MAKFYVCIDETGNFENRIVKSEDPSKVGGIVLKNRIGKHHINSICEEWQQKSNNFTKIKWSKLHYSPMLSQRDSPIPGISKTEALDLFDHLITSLLPQISMAFVSSGIVPFFSDAQQTYMETLRTTLWGLLQDQLITQNGDEVIVYIATRSAGGGMVGSWSPADRTEYHKFMAGQLENHFANLARRKGIKLRVEMVQANAEPMLTLADIFLGNHRENSSKLGYKKISVMDYYNQALGKEPYKEIEESFRNGSCPPVVALSQLVHLRTINQLKNTRTLPEEGRAMFKIFRACLAPEHLNQMTSFFDNIIDDLVRSRTENSENMMVAELYCKILIDLIDRTVSEHKANAKSVVKLRDRIFNQQVAIYSHKGCSSAESKSVLDGYKKFMEANQGYIHDTISKRLATEVDTELKVIQITHFNVYNFADVIDQMSPFYDRYSEMYGKLLEKGEKDALYAKICGTLAQGYGFLYAQTGKDEHYEYAKEYLEEDLKHLLPGRYYNQGLHYMVHLELLKSSHTGDMKEVEQLLQDLYKIPQWSFAKSLNDTLIDSNLGSDFDRALIVKCYAYYSHFHQQKQRIDDIGSIWEDLQDEKRSPYPYCNLMKWLAFLAYDADDSGLAKKILRNLGSFTSAEFTIQTMELPILLFQSYLKNQNPQEFLDKRKELSEVENTFRSYINAVLPIEECDKNNSSLDPWKIVTMLPFYYA